MTDPVDEALRKAMKASTDRSLRGWEFSPAMQRRVLERIRAEESGIASDLSEPPHRLSSRVLRPAAWTAAAAAALLMAANSGLISLRPGSTVEQSASQSEVAAKTSGEGQSEQPAAGQSGANGGAAAATGADAGGTQMAAEPGGQAPEVGRLELSARDASGVTNEPGEPAHTDGVPPAAAEEGSGSPVPPQAGGNEAASLPVAEPGAGGGAEPGAGGGAEPGADTGDTAIASVPSGPVEALVSSGRLVTLQVPAIIRGKAAPVQEPEVMGLLAMPLAAQTQQAAAPGGRLVELSGTGVRLMDADGNVLWERPLEGASGDGRLAVSATGRIAAGTGTELYILSSLGEVEHRLVLAATPAELLWTGNGFLAVAEPHQVGVYQEGGILWQVPLLTNGMVVLEKSSLLVTWGGEQAVALALPDGREVWRAVPGVPGAFMQRAVPSPDGAHVALLAAVDGGWALWLLDAQGTVLWEEGLPEEPLITFEGEQVRLEMPSGVQVRPVIR